jgi:hypothetical protein
MQGWSAYQGRYNIIFESLDQRILPKELQDIGRDSGLLDKIQDARHSHGRDRTVLDLNDFVGCCFCSEDEYYVQVLPWSTENALKFMEHAICFYKTVHVAGDTRLRPAVNYVIGHDFIGFDIESMAISERHDRLCPVKMALSGMPAPDEIIFSYNGFMGAWSRKVSKFLRTVQDLLNYSMRPEWHIEVSEVLWQMPSSEAPVIEQPMGYCLMGGEHFKDCCIYNMVAKSTGNREIVYCS